MIYFKFSHITNLLKSTTSHFLHYKVMCYYFSSLFPSVALVPFSVFFIVIHVIVDIHIYMLHPHRSIAEVYPEFYKMSGRTDPCNSTPFSYTKERTLECKSMRIMSLKEK